ncbi:MAG: outer membrane protein assembly factor BamC [Gammaproteobacteria bacterium]|nr:outer membrane protein assembly factor BamC [Rhodocyclaceae bacterium]MBU3908995.1 outer membrane protein assembly factor BamC [Gammaproteobacteria bacterium]MBU3988679.1 outer membrane protein assembly factor BamC [Gammaproteobacteria bacterium]MBU4021630.1 outer membrane protein assembly factor BamC [Gammaproteobacteria bacterium]MBU4094928.1 outer membrane protein assembly factor BamC [Gammaproteobacteria bacterium]
MKISSSILRTAPLLAASLLVLTACSGNILPESKKIEYKSAGNQRLPSLEVPPDLTQPSRDERYAVPDVTPKGSATFSAYSGERSGATTASSGPVVLPSVDKMRIERAGSQRWLVVAGTPENIWPSIKEFWQETGFIVNIELPEAGVLETDWAENRAKIPQDILRSTLGKVIDGLYSTAERDKFRTRLEKGAEAGTTEIYISHRGMYEVYINEGKSETRWQPRPADPDLEAEMLRRLMVRLGADEARAKTQMAAEPKQERAKLTRAADGAGTLTVQEPFDRAWRRVGLALDRVGFTVEDRDRTQGLYFVRYVDPEADLRKKDGDKGWLSKLAFWKSNKIDVDPKAQFRIQVINAGSDSNVRIVTREGGVDSSETARKILGLLFEQLK